MVEFHTAAGEFNGFAYDANRGVWKGGETLLNDVYNLIDVSSKIQDAVSWIESRVEQVFDNFIPFSNSNEQNGFFDIIENMNAILNKPLRLIQENGNQESEMLYPVAYVNEDGSLRYGYERAGRIITTSGNGANNSQIKKRNELKIEKPTDGVMLTNMTEEQFNSAMDIVEGNFIRKILHWISSDSREFKQTVKKLEEMNNSVMEMQKKYGGVGENGKKLSLRELVKQKGSVILGEAGKGMGQRTEYLSPDGTKKYFDIYDDKFTVLTQKDGEYILGEFLRGNMNPTNSYESLVTKITRIYQQGEETTSITNISNWIERLTTNRNVTIINTGPNLTNSTNVQINKIRDYIDGTTYWGELRDGIYGLDVKGSNNRWGYQVIEVTDNYNGYTFDGETSEHIGRLPSIRPNPRYGDNRNYISDVFFHKGGTPWNYSEGCQTLYKDDYDYFISLFRINQSLIRGMDGIYFKLGGIKK